MIEAWQVVYSIGLVTAAYTPAMIMFEIIGRSAHGDDGGPNGGLKLLKTPGARVRARGYL